MSLAGTEIAKNRKEPKNFELDAIMEKWCNGEENRQFAETTIITRLVLNDTVFDNIEEEAYSYYDPEFKTFTILPSHLRTDYQLMLLRYLRNYFAAKHGHQFKDEQLGKCFSGTKQAGTWSDTEKKNIEWILAKEKALKKINDRAWDQVRKKTIKEPGIFGLF